MKMAWRDGRKNWKRLLFYVSATSLGIGALIAAGSLQHNLEEALKQQAKPLLGADIVVRNRRPFSPEAEKFLSSLPYPSLREVELTTMGYFPNHDSSRLLEVQAIQDGFPFYGSVKTEPPNVLSEIFIKPGALIEENVMAEFGVSVGDTVELGRTRFQIVGALKMVPGEAMASVFSAPRAFIGFPFLKSTGLIQEESLARHALYFKIDNPESLKQALATIESKAAENTWRVNTVAERQKSLGRRADNASRFLKLAALIALLLGCIGVASILYVYAKDKRSMAATLKCLGAPATQTFGIFVLQGFILGLGGTLIGVAFGIGIQSFFPTVLRQLITIEIPFFISWSSILNGAAVGFGLSFLFTLLPLLNLRFVSPLAALRFDGASGGSSLAWLRRYISPGLPFAARHGLANLFRPGNQTYILSGALGFGSALIFMITFINNSLLSHIALSTSENEPNLALIDIQSFQQEGVRETIRQGKAVIEEEASIVTMRLLELKGVPVGKLLEDKNSKRPLWALRREYRSSYRNTLGHSEKVTAGAWPPKSFSIEGPIPIALEQGIAEDLEVGLNDEIVFDVQGVPMKTVIAAIRTVDWFQLRPNFFILFPKGVLEEAPQFTVMLARAPSVEATAAVQKEVRKKFPNVSTVDLRMVLATLEDYFNKVALALKFMALFVAATGIMILAGALISSRSERLREAALLRTLGAPSKDIRSIHFIEYGLIGLFSGVAGLFLGTAGGFCVTKFFFKTSFQPGVLPAVVGLGLMIVISILTGIFLGRGLLKIPPLQTLREEI